MNPKEQNPEKQQAAITRQEALRKMGKYAAATAAGTFILLNPRQAQADSLPRPGDAPSATEDAEYNNERSGSSTGYNNAASNYQSRSKGE
ncbi:hypothetical protein [Phaeodactylibacter xiamenensis]|uniref:hypothetical protein n=1 Tax=Phaeodactylibacter xiamenensis TaxID=1524460 RepID=UPI0024A7A70E|nr:hypothetical protein [Phaeodactylibacter xiamenensis]